MTGNRQGYRGYICARMGGGRSAPQHIQQLVMRDYCKQRNMNFLLSAVEYRMQGCTMILDGIIDELDHLEGIVMYSFFLMPESRDKREKLYKALFAKQCSLHLAVENIVIANEADAARVEESYLIQDVLNHTELATLSWLTEWDKNHAHASN